MARPSLAGMCDVNCDFPIASVCVCPLVLQKACAVRPGSARVVGELWAAGARTCQRGHAAHASSGEYHSTDSHYIASHYFLN